jgi:hypothetical protein
MTPYQVGQALPNYFPPGYELCRASFSPVFFDIVYWLPVYDTENIEMWQHGSLQYGIFTRNHIPFFVLHFPAQPWSIDVSLNIYSMRKELRETWLNRKEREVTILLCDCYKNTILDTRKITLQATPADQIRKVLLGQERSYPNAIQVQKQIEKIMDTTLTEDMLKEITLYRAI